MEVANSTIPRYILLAENWTNEVIHALPDSAGSGALFLFSVCAVLLLENFLTGIQLCRPNVESDFTESDFS